MNAPMYRDESGELLTVPQACRCTNLGESTLTKIAREAGAVRKIGRIVRIDKQILLQYINSTFSV